MVGYFKTELERIAKGYNIELVFIGDSVGGTDFEYGLNLGRGLLEVDFFVENLKKTRSAKTANLYQQYWDKIIDKEFNSIQKNINDLIADLGFSSSMWSWEEMWMASYKTRVLSPSIKTNFEVSKSIKFVVSALILRIWILSLF